MALHINAEFMLLRRVVGTGPVHTEKAVTKAVTLGSKTS
jgi:hypothetical protein